MASKRFEKGSTEYNLFSDLWATCQRYYVPEPENDRYYEDALNDILAFEKKYDGNLWAHEFAAAMTRAIHETEKLMTSGREVKTA